MKKLVLVPLVIVLAIGLILGGCAEEPAPAPAPAPSPTPSPAPAPSPAPSPAPTPSPAPSPAPAPEAEQLYRFKYSVHGAPTQTNQLVLTAWRRELEERSGGRIEIIDYFSASLLKYEDTYRGAQAGIADIIGYVIGQSEGVHFLNDFVRLPALGYESTIAANDIYHQLRDTMPEIEKEFQHLVVVNHFMMPPSQLHMTKKAVRVPQDMAGTKIISNATFAEDLKKVDSAVIITGYPDWYMSLERGLTEGLITHYPAVEGSGCKELFKHHTHIGGSGLAMGMHFTLMNEKVFNSLPADLQGIIMDTQLNRQVELDIMNDDIAATERIMNEEKAMGQTFYDCTPAEIDQWTELFSPIINRYIENCEAKGLPGRELLEENKRLIEESR
jgi:TRAP-type C4-dicarboxylate transport system substrate-binding protein